VLDWLGVDAAEAGAPPSLPGPEPEARFPWEPVPPAPRPPQWGAANLPELLLGQDDGACRLGADPATAPKP
jgi:hypothetical protein